MKKLLVLALALCLLISAAAAAADGAVALPETHLIPPDESMGTTQDEYGADAYQNALDHADSRYYVMNDYYNMVSAGSLHILSRFETYQQTTEYSCGCASALMVLNRFGIQGYNEMDICAIAETDTSRGTSVEGLVKFFTGLGLRLDYHAAADLRFPTIEACESFLLETIDGGSPILVDWVDWSGHWQVVIGIDTMDTDDPYDDVLILADPYDITDHFQDGYYAVPFGRFFYMWREGPCAEKEVPYEQPFVVVYAD